jgi:ComF family protein
VLLERWTDWTLRALFDPSCAACRGPVGPGRVGPVCRGCWEAVRIVSPPWCDRCGEPVRSWRHSPGSSGSCSRCVAHPPQFDLARAFGLYEGALREIVHALKYRGHRSLGPPLGALMKSADAGLLAGADAVVPVPLHPWRHWRRGFNQADELAQALGRRIWRPLRRRTLGLPQARLSGERRRTNVQTAYCVSSLRAGAIARRPRYVVLIDDVMTTGATLDACSRALREGGVEWIGALTLARAVTKGPTAATGGAARQPPPPRARQPSGVRR